MKRFGRLASCSIMIIGVVALAGSMVGCTSSQTYTPPSPTPQLSAPTLGKDGFLRVGIKINPPLAGQPTASSKLVGIDVDIAAALADRLGLKLEVIDVEFDPEAALSEGKVDIVMGVDKANTSLSFWTSEVYLPTAVALFSTSASAAVPKSASQIKVAAQISSKSAWAVANEFDQGTIETTQDLGTAFSQLKAGQVDYVAADAIVGVYAANRLDGGASIVALMQQPAGYAIGVLDSNTQLKTAVVEQLLALKNEGVIAVIESKWLGTPLNLSAMPLTEGASSTSTEAKSADVAEKDKSAQTDSAAPTAASNAAGQQGR